MLEYFMNDGRNSPFFLNIDILRYNDGEHHDGDEMAAQFYNGSACS